jgi:hypothetical protein
MAASESASLTSCHFRCCVAARSDLSNPLRALLGMHKHRVRYIGRVCQGGQPCPTLNCLVASSAFAAYIALGPAPM